MTTALVEKCQGLVSGAVFVEGFYFCVGSTSGRRQITEEGRLEQSQHEVQESGLNSTFLMFT